MSRIIFPNEVNHRGTVFGGKLLSWMDEVAGITAARYAGRDMATVAIEKVQFYKPVPVGAVVDVSGQVVHVGHTSLHVNVEVILERLDAEEDVLAAEAKFIYVALDEEGHPTAVVPREKA